MEIYLIRPSEGTSEEELGKNLPAICLCVSRDAFISISCDFFPSLFKYQATSAKRKYGTFSSQFPKGLL